MVLLQSKDGLPLLKISSRTGFGHMTRCNERNFKVISAQDNEADLKYVISPGVVKHL